ncbi:MAG: [acyl-carrier-protein] S-malonyltransferase [Actinobacteria bacterium HGW-Actinobacteria-1]|jgi:[acyl-carrier-protein] S-malonyltransferase|nr:MAG: [acyl-carrier-protein] S-malonyltransferase [Actinobacteria bacterium HGW-Actinobacteria-1]
MSMRTHALVFPGQGSQRVGMLETLPEHEDLNRLLDAAEALSGLPLRSIAVNGPADSLSDTRAAQPLLYLTDWVWGMSLLDCGLDPAFVAGHSLGEYAALAIAGVFSAEAGLELVTERSALMAATAQATPGTMAAVLGMERSEVAELVESLSEVWMANDNSATQVVLSGTHHGIEAATTALTAAGARRIVPLTVAGPFHSPLMAPAGDRFATIVAEAQFSDATIPVLQNTDPTPATAEKLIKARLLGQITSPVRWTETVLALRDAGVEVIVEAGTGAVLTGLARKVDGIEAVAVEDGGIERVLEVLGA